MINYSYLKKGEFFGEKSFLTGSRQPCNAVSISFSTVYVIERDSFLKILSEKQSDFVISLKFLVYMIYLKEKYCEMRDKMVIYSNLEDLKKRCNSCLKKDHDIFTCPEIHYFPRKDFIIKRHLYSQPRTKREIFKRNGKKHNAFKILHVLMEKMLAFESLTKLSKQEKTINEEYLDDEYSDSDLIDVPDSPFIDPALNRKQITELSSFKRTTTTDEDIIQKLHEEQKLVSFDDESKIKKKDKKSISMMGTGVQSTTNTFNHTSKLHKQSVMMEQNWEIRFEKMNVFTRYFVENNLDLVLKQYQIKMAKRNAKIQKMKLFKQRKKTMINSPNKSIFGGNLSISLKKKRVPSLKNGNKDRNEFPEMKTSVFNIPPHKELQFALNFDEMKE